MFAYAIPIVCLLAHAQLVLVFLPGMWREIDARGLRWHNVFVLFVGPLAVSGLIASHIVANLSTVPSWLVVVAALTVDAYIVAAVLSAVALSRRRRQTA